MLSTEEIVTTRRVVWANKGVLPQLVRQQIVPAKTVLDVGCGIRPQTLVWPKLHVCVDAHHEYVDYLRARCPGSPHYLVIHSTWKEALRIFPARSVDTVFALDFIEHLPKEEGFEFLKEAGRIARKQIVLFTPLGFFRQCYEGSEDRDRWGMRGGKWQTHRSGWVPEDFPLDWEILACRDYHTQDQDGPLDMPRGGLWAIRTFPTGVKRGSMWEWLQWGRTMMHTYLPPWLQTLSRAVWSKCSSQEQRPWPLKK